MNENNEKTGNQNQNTKMAWKLSLIVLAGLIFGLAIAPMLCAKNLH
jgi:hypothetical protein